MSEELVQNRIVPEAALIRPPTWIQCARELYRLPADWKFVISTVKGSGDDEYFEIEGGVYKTAYKSGPRKGEINYKKPEPGTGCTVSLLRSAYQNWQAQWEADTGLCFGCDGSGYRLASCCSKGTFYRSCNRCNGTGQAKLEAAA